MDQLRSIIRIQSTSWRSGLPAELIVRGTTGTRPGVFTGRTGSAPGRADWTDAIVVFTGRTGNGIHRVAVSQNVQRV